MVTIEATFTSGGRCAVTDRHHNNTQAQALQTRRIITTAETVISRQLWGGRVSAVLCLSKTLTTAEELDNVECLFVCLVFQHK